VAITQIHQPHALHATPSLVIALNALLIFQVDLFVIHALTNIILKMEQLAQHVRPSMRTAISVIIWANVLSAYLDIMLTLQHIRVTLKRLVLLQTVHYVQLLMGPYVSPVINFLRSPTIPKLVHHLLLVLTGKSLMELLVLAQLVNMILEPHVIIAQGTVFNVRVLITVNLVLLITI
jgi:hypothetical protein